MGTKFTGEAVAERLREARIASGLSQAQVAKKLDLHRPTVTEIEAGRRKVSAQELEGFAEIYAVSVAWIIHGASGDDPADAKVLMAARELSKMTDADLARLTKALQMLRKKDF
jgi:transcriptional regulator with XRE-family HTH domain